jgi:hypothetical protein
MTQAGTINLGGSAQTKRSGSLWPVIALTLALVLAMIAAVLFASNAGRVGGSAAKPVADWSYNQIEAQRGAIMLSTDASLNSILDRAHATPYLGGRALSTDAYLNGILDRAHATPFAGAATTVQISATSGTFHATPATGGATAPLVSATSGTFHATPAVVGPAKRNHVGGPR